MVDKRLEVRCSCALVFVDREKAFDTLPREMVMATLRWMGVPEAEVGMVDGTYEKTTARVVTVQAGTNAWRAVEGVMADRRISKSLKGKVMSTCVTPACLYGTEILALATTTLKAASV